MTPSPDSVNDPFAARLSDYLDGHLEAAEVRALEAHLAGCGSCRALLSDLRRITAAARALPERAPGRDLWPELALRLGGGRRASRRGLVLAFAAGVLATLGVAWLLGRGGEEARVAATERYLLLLHDPPELDAGLDAAAHAAVVERYASWGRELGARCLDGEELEPSGLELLPGEEPRALPEGTRVGGYFVLAARDRAEALEMARSTPHLERGGWVELRRIRER